jgi:acetate kinase
MGKANFGNRGTHMAQATNDSDPPPSTATRVLTINGGSSSIKFALYAMDDGVLDHSPHRLLDGQVERIGEPGVTLTAKESGGALLENRSLQATDHSQAAAELIDWLQPHLGSTALAGIGHRVVHGGAHLLEHQWITEELLDELRRTQLLDLAHLPREIALIEAFRRSFPDVPQAACFDTAFHRDLPRLAKLLPIPRRYDQAGIRRFGFHGLSYAYLLEELRRLAGPEAADGRIILAHLGSGASLAAVHHGKPIDTSMAFTPTAGLVMGTRPGDLDPGLLAYLMRIEQWTPEKMDDFLNQRCGLIGVSETSSDTRDLIARRATDTRAAEAVDLFCYQAKKWIGSFTAALGGLDTLVFAGGIGEHSPPVRAGICAGLEFLGIHVNKKPNEEDQPVISTPQSRVTVRVVKTDEEVMIAKAVCRLLRGM